MTPEQEKQFEDLRERVLHLSVASTRDSEKLTRITALLSRDADQKLEISERVRQNTDAQLAIRRELTELNGKYEGVPSALLHIERMLAIIAKDVDDAEKASLGAQNAALGIGAIVREVTGQYRTVAPEKPKEPTAWERMFDRFSSAPLRTQLIIFLTIVVLTLAGWTSAAITKLQEKYGKPEVHDAR